MAKYKVTLEFEANGELGLNEVEVEVDAAAFLVGPDWVVFDSTVSRAASNAATAVAAFPTARVTSIVRS
jgi:hypothetical protein